jgi:hypothetical protein
VMCCGLRFLAGTNTPTMARKARVFRIHHSRPLMESLGFVPVKHGESNDE